MLSTKQQAFVEHYLTCWNAAEAARRAGYSEKTARSIGAENLTKPDIQAAISARLAELKMGADEVLTRLAAQARASIADVLSLPPVDTPDAQLHRNHWSLDLVKAQRTGAIHHIKKIKATKYGTEVELYDAQAALVKLGEHHQLWGKGVDVLKYINLSKLSPEQLERIANGEDPLAVLLANPTATAASGGGA